MLREVVGQEAFASFVRRLLVHLKVDLKNGQDDTPVKI
jgi:hypothetical protein